MAEFLEILSPKALADLQSVNAELVKTIASVKEVNSNMISVKSPSGSDSAMKALTAQYEVQAKTIANLQNQLQQLARTRQAVVVQENASIKSSSTQTKNTREQAVAQQILRAETDRQFRSTTLLGGAYARASAQLLVLKKEAKDAAIAFGEQSVQAQRAAKAASELDTRIKSADAAVGDYQRNVGNYSGGIASGFKGIYSQARILANILPGIGIAGIFGLALDPLMELIKGMDLFKVKIDSVKESKKALEEINKEATVNAVGELVTLKGNLATAKDINLSYKERMIAVENLQKSYPFYFENLTKEQILAGETKAAEDALTESILSRAKANAAIGKITENESKILDLRQKQIDLSKDLTQAALNEERAISYAKNAQGARGEAAAIGAQTAIERKASIMKEIKNTQTDINALEKINDDLTKYAISNQEKSIGLDYKEAKAKKESNKARKEKIEAIKLEAEKMDTLLLKLEEQKKLLTQVQLTSENNAQWQYWQKAIDGVQQYIDWIKKGFSELKDSAKKSTDEFERLYGHQAKKKVEEMAKATRDWIDSFNTSFLKDFGVGALDMFFRVEKNGKTVFQNLYDDAQKVGEGWKVSFLGMSQVAEETFALISQFSQQNYQAQYDRLEQEKNVAILFAGESVSAKEEIEKQYEQKRRRLARQEAEEKKKTATFKAIIDTAQAVVSALPNIPLSIAVGIIGAAQIALIQSQQLPAFATGTDNAPEGWALTQEKGAEIITDKSGKVKSMGSNKGAQYTYLNKGDKVFTAEQSEAIMFNKQLNGILSNNGIGMPIINMNDNSDVVSEIQSLKEVISNKPSLIIQQDERGRRVYERKQAETKQLLNNHLTYKGYDI